jgi:hypothetical protein
MKLPEYSSITDSSPKLLLSYLPGMDYSLGVDGRRS